MGRPDLGCLSLGRLGRNRLELLGRLDREFAAHADRDPERVSRRLRSTMATWSSGPSRESTAPASADSTVQAKVSLAGMHGSAGATAPGDRPCSGEGTTAGRSAPPALILRLRRPPPRA